MMAHAIGSVVQRIYAWNEVRGEWVQIGMTQEGDPVQVARKMDTVETLFADPNLVEMAIAHKQGVMDVLYARWGVSISRVGRILRSNLPSQDELLFLSDVIHDHVPIEIETEPVLEAVSYVLGNNGLFGKHFKDRRLRDAVAQRF